MVAEALFTITQDQLETGMRGYPVGYCTTSSVDPMDGLAYIGKPISECAEKSPEEVIYLLFYGKEGTVQEIKTFSQEIKKRQPAPEGLIKSIRALPRESHPMTLFGISLLLAQTFSGTGDYREDALRVMAQIPEITATVINHHAGWTPKPSRSDLGYMENFTQMLGVPHSNPERLDKVFRLFNILHYDHDGGNLSTFVGKAVASGLASLYSSLAAAMAALSGPRHGGANEECLNFVKEVIQEVSENASVEQVENLIRTRLAQKKLIFGFGHAVLRVEDPRATIFYQTAAELFPEDPLVRMALLLRQAGTKVLKENPKISNPYPNVDAISGTLLSAAGFPYPEYFTVLFGMARVVGISQQIVYERCEAHEGKGTPIIRPTYYYKERKKL